ncbi:DUF2171 domain-containing protein [Zavarzinella formosa]|uniref:DUF2171 domain-containing protein n=1 Tax=Zavarzinella formosa TaxID=360055 RepID=UPI0003193D59|nr:DUF2171 domain-containing protein [Zavarzinella formosa]
MGIKKTLESAGEKISETAKTAGEKISETAKDVGHKIADGAETAADWVKDKTGLGKTDSATAKVKPHMDVIASCGTRVGAVDHLDGESIKLTRNDVTAGGVHHWVPVSWIDHVDAHVHLNKNSEETRRQWTAESAA